MAREYNRRKRRAELRLRRIIVLCVLAALLAGLIFGITALLRSCKTSVSRRTLPFSPEDGYFYTGGGFLYTDEQKINYTDLSDESKSFSIEAQARGASVIGTERIKAVYSSSSIQIIGTPFEHTVEGVIKKAVCGGKYLAAYVENADNTHSLLVYNSAGEMCYRADLGTGVLLDFGFEGGDSAAMYMSELAIAGSAVSTTVTTIDLARESITGVMNIRGELVKGVYFTKKSVFIFATDSLIRFDRESNAEAYRMLVRGYECEDTCRGDGKLYLLLSKSGEQSEHKRVICVKEGADAEETVLELSSDTDALACFVMRGRAVAVHEGEIVVRAMDGTVKARLPLSVKARSVKKPDESALIIDDGENIYLYNLKNL